jgi:hypothetical protein
MPLIRGGPMRVASDQGVRGPMGGGRGWAAKMGTVVKFPDEGRIVRFGRAEGAEESATVIILPVVRVERYDGTGAETAEPQTHPPAENGGRRRMRRR